MTGEHWDLVTVVVVTYNSSLVIGDCLRSVASAKKVIVVDNASDDDTIAKAKDALPSVHIVRNADNFGYGTGNNVGIALAETPYALILNPDATVDGDCIRSLVRTAGENPNAASVAPIILKRNGESEFHLRWFHDHDAVSSDQLPDGPLCTGFIMGAVVLWNVEHWKTIGGFDEAIFLYNEDQDLSFRTHNAGFTMIVDPSAKAWHLSGKSARPSWRGALRRDWHMMWGDLYVQAKWRDPEKARQRARAIFIRYGWKAVLYTLLLRPRRMLGNFVKAHAAYTWMTGGRAWQGRQINSRN